MKNWKFKINKKNIFKILFNLKKNSLKLIFLKSNIIPFNFLNVYIYIFNGLLFKKIFLLNYFICLKFGIFINTKKFFFFKKK